MGGFAGLVDLICDGSVISPQTLAETLCDLFGNDTSLQDGVERYICEHDDDFETAIAAFLTTRTSAIVAAQQVDPQWSSDKSKEDSIKRVLSKLGLPINQHRPRPIGAIQVLDRLSTMHIDFLADKSAGHIEPDKLRSIPLNAWAYVERLIRMTIGFYAMFYGSANSNLQKLFEKAKKAHSLGPLFKAIKTLDNGFKQLPPDQCKQVERDLHRATPFAGFSFDSYIKLKTLRNYRNFFAHSEIEIITAGGFDRVENGLKATIDLVQELHKTGVAPSVIFPIAQGKDEHGRGLIWFIEERHAFETSGNRCKHQKCMFKRNHGPLVFRSPYLTISPLRPRMFEPPLLALSEISGVYLDE